MPDTSEVTSDYSGSLSDETSTEESDDGDEKKIATRQINENTSLLWTGVGSKRCPVLIFRPDCSVNKDKKARAIGERYHLAYKMVKTESKLVRSVLSAYGFHEVHPNSSDFNLMWTGAHLKPFSLRNLQDFQKVNHFPRSYEITRKDRLYKNIERMGHTKGQKHFDFIPKSFLMPSEYQEFCAAYVKEKGSWIVKPIASSRGRGIYLINNPNQVPLEDNIMVCRYVSNPLLIDGFKFDIRVYVAITSYDPLLIYLFEEGLTRFATVKYEKTNRHIKNQMMHLTNYSINKKSHDYVRCEDPTVEDYGNKWSMSAMLRYLKQEGIDTAQLMLKIEAVIIKSIIAAELPIATACRMFVPHRENCIELHGFDILVDENLKPWILEGNLSPSLACDAPLDLKIKSSMVADFFSLAGFHCVDPLVKKKKAADVSKRPMSAKSTNGMQNNLMAGGKRPVSAGPRSLSDSLSPEEAAVVKMAKEQFQRRGSFVRIFPTPETWEVFGSFLEYKSSLNSLLAQRLFPDMKKYSKSSYGAYSGAVARIRSAASKQMYESRSSAISQRYMQYERKLLALETSKRRKITRSSKKETPIGVDKESSSLRSSKPAVKEAEDSDESSGSESIREPRTPKKASAGSLKSVSVASSNQSAGDKRARPVRTGGAKAVPVVRGGSKQVRKVSTSSETSSSSRTTPVGGGVGIGGGGVGGGGDVRSKPLQRVYMYKATTENKHAVAASNPQPSSSAEVQESSAGEEEKRRRRAPYKDVLESLKSDGNLGKVQARQAFSAYLTKVQHRLIMEAKSHSSDSQEAVSKQEEQMDLVLRFLKRAASNLHQPFTIMVPSHRLVLTDRKRILSKQLGDFIQIYNRETDQMETKHHIHYKSTPSSKQSIPDPDFQSFVSSASENTLEEVLTTYTHKNKSASVFLGASKPKPSSAREASSSGEKPGGKPGVNPGTSPPPARLHREAFANKSDAPKSPYMRDERPNAALKTPHPSPTYMRLARSHSASSLHHQPPLSPYHAPTNLAEKFPQAPAMLQRRPNSAKVFRDPAEGTTTTTTQPLHSSSMLAGSHYHSTSAVNQEAIADALQRLTKRQAARQYSASVQLNALTQHLSSLNLTNMSRSRPPMPKGELQQMAPKSTSLCELATSDPSVQSMVEPSHYNLDPHQEGNMKKLQRNVGDGPRDDFIDNGRHYKQKPPTVMSQVIEIWKKRSREAVVVGSADEKISKSALVDCCLSHVPSIPDLTRLLEEVHRVNAAKKVVAGVDRESGVHSLHGKPLENGSLYKKNQQSHEPLCNEPADRSGNTVHFSSNSPKPPYEVRAKQRPPVLKKIPRNFKSPFLTNGPTDSIHAQSSFYDNLKYNASTGATETSYLSRIKTVTQGVVENSEKGDRPGSARPWKP